MSSALTSLGPSGQKQYMGPPLLKLADKPHEVFAVLFIVAEYRMIEFSEMFYGTLAQTSVYPRQFRHVPTVR